MDTSQSITNAPSITLIPARDPEKRINISKAPSAPQIDGKLDDAVWQTAPGITDLVQYQYNWGQDSAEKTIVQVTSDENYVYFGIRCFTRDPHTIRANYSNRDGLYNDDWVMISLDTFNSKKRGLYFGVNPYGIQFDGTRDENDQQDPAWDAVFQSKGVIDEKGWTAEVAIPIKMLRFSNEKLQTWGLMVQRKIAETNELSSWPVIKKEIRPQMGQAGEIKGLEVKPTHTFEVTPYVAGGYDAEHNEKNGELEGDKVMDIGLDVKYGLRSDLVLDVAVNPDFSQIEADPEQIEINRRY